MIQIYTDERQTALNDLIEAFEAARAEHDEVDLTEFLPAADHPLYPEARRELLRVDLELSWQDGRRQRMQDFVKQFPDLLADRTAVQEIAFEEFRLRMFAGEAPLPTEYEELYGVTTTGWTPSANPSTEPKRAEDQGTELALFMNVARTLSRGDSWHSSRHGDVAQALLRQNVHQSSAEAVFLLAQAMTALPEVGSTFLSFELIAELGHGSFGRVYLARQGDLANRLVALKITVDLLGEEQKLAQLQHTNVVPIYSVHQAGPFQAVCMPYFGPTTLADVIRAAQGQATIPTSGREVVRALHDRKTSFRAQVQRAEAGAQEPTEIGPAHEQSAALKMLEGASYVDAVLSIAEGVAEGLIHAHERGILHRDLKPANILLTDEGRPMLVDFNLSADLKLHMGLSELQVGGTLPYMAPENLESMQGASRTTDARSDLYALGVVLFELLTGRLPFAARAGHLPEILPAMIADRLQAPPRLRRWNPGVSPAVQSIVRHCLQPDPAQRYQSAADLHDDLQRQRHHRPLRCAPEPSLVERTRKWTRRHPRLTSPSSLGGVAIFLVLCYMAPFAWEKWQLTLERATTADHEADLAKRKSAAAEGTAKATYAQINALLKFREFEKTAASSRPIMESVSIMQMLPEAWAYEEKRLTQAEAECRRSLQVYRVLDEVDWQRQPAVGDLRPKERDKLLRKIAELLYALAHADQARLAWLHEQARPYMIANVSLTLPGRGGEVWGAWEAMIQAKSRSALALNEQASACFRGQAMPWYLAYQKAELTEQRGSPLQAKRLQNLAENPPWSEDADENYWAASMLVAHDRSAAALPWLQAATEQFPYHAGAWFLLAWCQHHRDNAKMAEACYDNYLALRPEGIWGYYNRGLLSLKQGYLSAEKRKHWSAAEKDFSKVLEKNTGLAWAYGHRASARHGLGKNLGAIADLTRAIQLAPEVPEFYLIRARVHAKLHNWKDEKLDRDHFLRQEPKDYSGWLYRGVAKSETDPNGALADFEKALALNPECTLTLFNKARLLADAAGRTDESIGVLNRVLDIDPNFPGARFKRGILLAKMGARDKAVADAERLIQYEPTPARYYEAASIYALTSRKDRLDAIRAIHLLRYALRHDYGVREYQTDPNLAPLANFMAFDRLAEGLEILGAGTLPPRILPSSPP